IWLISSNGIVVLLIVVESSNLSPGNHSLRSLCNLPRTSAAKCDGNLKAATNFKQRHNVVCRNAFDEPKSGRRNVTRPLREIKRMGFIGAAESQLARELRCVFATGK